MPNAIYPRYKQACLTGGANTNTSSGTVRAVLVDTGTAQEITTKTFTDGVFDGDNVTFPAVSGASAEAIVVYIDTGTPATSRLVSFQDTGVTGLPVTPNGGAIGITWNASGIFAL